MARCFSIAAVLLSTLIAGSALAGPTPPSISVRLDPGGAPFVFGTTTGPISTGVGLNSVSADVELAPIASVLVHAYSDEDTSNPNGYYEPSASASLDYDYSASITCNVSSPCAQMPGGPANPLAISGYVGSRVNGVGSYASIHIGDAYGISYYCYEGGSDCGVQAFSYAPSVTGATVGSPGGGYTTTYSGHLTLYVAALANTRTFGLPGEAEAYLDPLIAFDPNALAAGGFSAGEITLSPGVANASGPLPIFATVPEPASWTMLIAGFALTGVAIRRRAPLPAA